MPSASLILSSQLAALTATVAICSAVGCGNTSQGSTCGPGLTASAGSHHVPLTSCAGQVGMSDPTPSLTVKQGASIKVKGIGVAYKSPRSLDPAVVAVSSSKQSTVYLTAMSPGTTIITIVTPFCLVQRVNGGCPAFSVTVKAR